MYRLTKFLFWFSDVLAWLLAAFAFLTAVTYPIAGPVWARMEHQQLATSSIIVTCLLWLSVALGAYLLTRRRIVGLALLIVPILVAASSSGWLAGFIIMAFLALVFGLPFLLVLLGARPDASRYAP